MKCEWKSILAKDFIEFNPKITLKKGTIAKKVAMDKVLPYTKYINEFEYANYTGGSKFQNGDTIMARITPCLENGKTAFVDFLDENEIGFGSTEFIVLRERKGISDAQYIYYLSISPQFRKIAINSMVGSSGRQRVQQSVLDELELFVPDINEQRKIANILNKIDEKIRINNRINDNLEKQVASIYQSWFENFDITNGIFPKNWYYKEFASIATIESGKRPPLKSTTYSKDTPVPIIGATSIMGYTVEANHTNKILVIGRVGTHGIVQRFCTPCWTSDNTLVVTSPYYEFTNQILQKIDYTLMNRGSTQPLITQGDMKRISILVPDDDTLVNFEKLTGSLMDIWEINIKENTKLASLRNTLLSKLMCNKLDVSSIDI